jgi:putative membrane protein
MFTTAHSSRLKRFAENRLLQLFAVLYGAVWIWAAIAPKERSTWLLENLLVVVAVGLMVWICRVRPLSDFSNLMIVVFLTFHTVGSHYTYSLVPLGDWMKETFGFERNHYDRVIHFTFGFLLAYPLREVLLRSPTLGRKWVDVVAFTLIATFSGFYELIEWGAAAVVDPESGTAFLGTQGDEFDSQKDHALACLGAVITLAVTRLWEPKSARAK